MGQIRERLPDPLRLRIAAVAALIASVSDLLMLLVANGDAGQEASTVRLLLGLGALLGVAAIPVYLFGYQAASRAYRFSHASRSFYLMGAGLVALFGAITHALTAIDIRDAWSAGLGARPPSEAFADFGSPLVLAASIAAVGAILSAICLVSASLRHHERALRLAAILNPVVWTLVLGAAASLSEATKAYLAPTAPNLAHFLFFAFLLRAMRNQTPS